MSMPRKKKLRLWWTKTYVFFFQTSMLTFYLKYALIFVLDRGRLHCPFSDIFWTNRIFFFLYWRPTVIAIIIYIVHTCNFWLLQGDCNNNICNTHILAAWKYMYNLINLLDLLQGTHLKIKQNIFSILLFRCLCLLLTSKINSWLQKVGKVL